MKLEKNIHVFVRARDVLQELEIPYVIGGGLAVGQYNHQRVTKDIDFFITEESAEDAIEALHHAGFLIKRSDPNWLYQSWWDDTLVDLVFAINVSRARIPVDDELISRGQDMEICGEPFRIISPEDLVSIKILVMHENRPDWWDAITIIRKRRDELDWRRIMQYASVDMKKFLAFLLFTQSRHWSEVLWPKWVLDQAWNAVGEEMKLAYPSTRKVA